MANCTLSAARTDISASLLVHKVGNVKGLFMCQGFEEIFTAFSVTKHLMVLGHTVVIIQIRILVGISRLFKKQLLKCL